MFSFIAPEERFNVITHAIGVLFSVLITLYFFTNFSFDDPRVFIGIVVYCFSLIFLFSSSTIYHAVSGKSKFTWRKIDHIAILFLIAGSYTPVTLTVLYETSGLFILKGVWSIAALGFIFKIFYTGKYESFSLIMYLGLGWFILFYSKIVLNIFPASAIIYLVIGGLFYSAGVFFYKWKGYKESHAIWHIFVLLGAIFHAFMIRDILITYIN